MRFYSLKELFELRKSVSLRPRHGFVRLFLFKEKLGAMDSTGAVWPIELSPDSSFDSLKMGVVYRVALIAKPFREAGSNMSPRLQFSELSQVSGSQDAPWSVPRVANPQVFLPTHEPALSTEESHFFSTLTSERSKQISQRSLAISCARQFLNRRGYIELDPPQLVISGGVERYLKVFKTSYQDHRGQVWDMELPTSPEFSLKKIATEGVGKIFALTHAFRNEGELSKQHDPEFLMLEWYRLSQDFQSLINETQELVNAIAASIDGAPGLPKGSWPQFTVDELFLKFLNIDLRTFDDVEKFRDAAAKVCLSIVQSDSWDDVFCKLFMEFIEPELAKYPAAIVSHYPSQMGALAQLTEGSRHTVDRFEAYLFGVEICNGYRELTDFHEYRNRVAFVQQERSDVRRDPQFESCLEVGLYPCVGNALGLDRVIALLMRQNHLQDILPWPFESRFPEATIALE